MPTPTTSAGHYDPLLTTMSVAFFQNPENFIARRVFANLPVAEKSGKYFEYPKGATMRPAANTTRPLGEKPAAVGYDIVQRDYACEERSLESFLDDRQKANFSSPHNGERMAVKLLVDQMLMMQEIDFAARFWGTSIWGSDITGVTSAPSASQAIYWNLSTGVPVAEIKKHSMAIHKRTGGRKPNTLILGADVWLALEQSADILSRIQQTQRGVITLDILRGVFDVERIFVATGVYNSAAEGATGSIDWIVGPKNALLAYVAPEPALEEPSAGYTMAWTGLAGTQALTNIATVKRGRDERASTDWFQVQSAWQHKVISAECATFFSGIVQ